jgi:hypothetical protein
MQGRLLAADTLVTSMEVRGFEISSTAVIQKYILRNSLAIETGSCGGQQIPLRRMLSSGSSLISSVCSISTVLCYDLAIMPPRLGCEDLKPQPVRLCDCGI